MALPETFLNLKSNEILHAAFMGKEKQSQKPILLMITGGYGIGKTPMTQMLTDKEVIPSSSIAINPRLFIPHFAKTELESVRHPELLPQHIESYYKICYEIAKKASDLQLPIIFTDIGDRTDKIKKILQYLRVSGQYTLISIGLVNPLSTYPHTITNNIGHKVPLEIAKNIQIAFIRNWRSFYEINFDYSALFTYNDEVINSVRSKLNQPTNNFLIWIEKLLTSREFSREYEKIFSALFAEKYKRLLKRKEQ